jgi:hypothetical protein
MQNPILDKLEKLLRLSKSDNVHEAELAMMHAQRLAMAHNIDLARVAFEEEKKTTFNIIKKPKPVGQRKSIIDNYLRFILNDFFGVNTISCGCRKYGYSLHFIGEEDKIDFAMYVYDFLYETFFRLWKKERAIRKWEIKMRDSYMYGLYHGLSTKLKDNQKQMESELESDILPTYAIVLADYDAQLEIAKHSFFPIITFQKAKARVIYSDPFEAGEEKGKQININKALN